VFQVLLLWHSIVLTPRLILHHQLSSTCCSLKQSFPQPGTAGALQVLFLSYALFVAQSCIRII